MVLALVLTGCISVPPMPAGKTAGKEDIFSHVEFLSQPRLKGRKPGTLGSRAARQYIEARFKAYGLVPWGEAKSYEQSFNYGRNIVGVLPGSDPSLAKEFVLVSAHYDHLGKDAKGKVCPGAADNASGVAALLEIARELSTRKEHPKRSVAFVAFDCEEWMLFGSFAFSSQPDVESAKIAAVVNMDILGRDLMDVVRNTLFVAGAEDYPEIQAHTRRLGQASGIRVLPLGTDLVGPRSDHVAFQSRGMPCLFFSSGTYKDYHQPGDTAEKLNRADLERSAAVVLGITLELANGGEMKKVAQGNDAHAEELKSIITVMAEVNGNLEQAGIKKEDAEAFQILANKAARLSKNGRYDGKERDDLIADAAGVLAPYFLPADMMAGAKNPEQQKEFTMAMRCLQQFYAQHGADLLEGYRRFVRQMLKYRPNLVRGMPKFQYDSSELGAEDIVLAKTGEHAMAMNAIATCLSLRAECRTSRWLVKSFGFSMGLSYDGWDCEGTREQIVDYCLLRLRRDGTNEAYRARTAKVLAKVAESDRPSNELKQERQRSGGFADEADWIASCMRSESPQVALEATIASVNDPRVRKAACSLVNDKTVRGDIRAAAIRLLARSTEKTARLALCDALEDSAPVEKREYWPMFSPDYPFADRVVVQTVRPILEKQMKADLSRTIGDLAHSQLKKGTGKDFGRDPQAWRDWVLKNAK
jgi:hypothetical protein